MNQRSLFFIFVSALATLSLGSIRRTEDPIRDTQTNPILYEQKKEEEKDGKKGPLMYNVKYNPRAGFLTDPPIEKEKIDASNNLATTETSPVANTASWWEEEPKAPQQVVSAETTREPSSSVSSGTDAAQDEMKTDPSVTESTAAASGARSGDGTSTQGEANWW